MKNKRIIIISLLMVMLLLSACTQLKEDLDVIGKGSIVTFETLLEAMPAQLQETEDGGWSLTAPDGGAKFIFKKNWDTVHDVALAIDPAPFVVAGLDVAKLPDYYAFDGEVLTIGTELGALTTEHATTPLDGYKQIVKFAPDSIGYHSNMAHYGVSLGNGNMFEWAKDLKTNDKDIVFVLNPQPLIEAGVDPNAVEGWTCAKVPMHEGGKTVEVDKLLRPIDLQ